MRDGCEFVKNPEEFLQAPFPAKNVHKFTRGKLIVVGGSAAYPGAAVLAARAGQRMGAGYVEVLCDPESVLTVRMCAPSLVVRPWCSLLNNDLITSKTNKPVAYVIGPGFDASQQYEFKVLEYVLAHAEAPVLVDGGALACLAESDECTAALRARRERGLITVLTPHGGEAAKLAMKYDITCVGCNELPDKLADYAAGLSNATGAIVVLKGPDTYVANDVCVCCVSEGTAALAKAGTGDVLAGIIGAYLAQGIAPFTAAVSGVVMHAKAGCSAAEKLTDISVIPEDVIACIPDAIRMVCK